MSLPPDVIRAVERYGPRIDKLAKTRYGVDGSTLLAKLIQGESGGRKDAVSKAGARGWAQFMPSTRQGVIQRFGIDPWRSPDEAVHAAVLHLTGKLGNRPGLEGYNPGGGSSYVHYILGQKVNLNGNGSVGAPQGVSGTGTVQTTYSSPSMPTGSTGLAGLLKAASRPVASVGSIAPPSFAATPHLPQGAPQVPSVGGGGGVSQNVTDALQQTMGLRGPELGAATTTGQPGQPGPSGGTRIEGAIAGSPLAGVKPHGATHPTLGLAGYPAFDYMAKAGTPVVAPVTGKIIKLSGHDPKNGPTQGPHGPFGYSVYVQGNDGRVYFLTHLGSRNVKAGQRIEQGDEIGTVGNYAKWGGANHVHMGVHG